MGRKFPFAALGLIAGTAVAAASETGPVIVIPGRTGVPVIIDGNDVSYAVVEGDWGLAKPSQTNPRVIFRYFPPPRVLPRAAHYFPSIGQAPKLGRKEVDVPRPPEPAEGYTRTWGSESAPTPATSPTPLDTPPMVVVPEVGRRRP